MIVMIKNNRETSALSNSHSPRSETHVLFVTTRKKKSSRKPQRGKFSHTNCFVRLFLSNIWKKMRQINMQRNRQSRFRPECSSTTNMMWIFVQVEAYTSSLETEKTFYSSVRQKLDFFSHLFYLFCQTNLN